MYRNEIRKSIKNILSSQQISKKAGSNNDATDYFNNRKNMIASGIYLSSSSSSSGGTAANGNNDLTFISSINGDNKSNKPSGVGSIKYKPSQRRPVIYLDRCASYYTNTQTVVTNPNELLNKIQINKINSNGEIIEFDSRV